MRILPVGDTAVMLDCDDHSEAQAWHAALDPRTEAVLGARTVLVRGRPDQLRRLIAITSPAPPDREQTMEIVVQVRYDGPDLADVARLTRLSFDEVIAAHTGTPWNVAFTGFAPGFAYLTGGDVRLQVPRRPTPRTAVPPGSVALAGPYSGVYPRTSPGGWQIIGHTTAALWDLDRQPPALLQLGAHVRFEAIP